MSQTPVTTAFDPTDPQDPVNLVRMLIGDTTEPYLVTDETIAYFLDLYNGNVYMACVPCLRIMGAHYMQMADKTVGRLSISYSVQYQRIADLIKAYEGNVTQYWRTAPGSVVVVGGGPKVLTDWQRVYRERALVNQERLTQI